MLSSICRVYSVGYRFTWCFLLLITLLYQPRALTQNKSPRKNEKKIIAALRNLVIHGFKNRPGEDGGTRFKWRPENLTREYEQTARGVIRKVITSDFFLRLVRKGLTLMVARSWLLFLDWLNALMHKSTAQFWLESVWKVRGKLLI